MENNNNNNSNFIENLKETVVEPIISLIYSINKLINTQEFKNFAEQFIFLSNNIEDGINLLDKYNWFIPDSISFIDFQKFIFLILNENITQNEIDKAFLDFYFGNNFKELELIINDLKENMEEERFLIIKDCFNVLKDNFENKNYNSSNLIIPTLLIHIDRYKLDVQEFYLKNKEQKKGEKREKILVDEIKKDEAFFGVSNQIEYLIEKLFKDSKEIDKDISNGKKLTDEDLYRHKIMHGQHLKYGSYKNVLKCFLILEYIKNLHNDIKNGKISE